MTNAYIQKLVSDGVHKDDYYTNRSWYQNCPSCNCHYADQKWECPQLLICGHVICLQCSTDGKPCGCCDKPKIIRIHNYKTLLQSQSTFNSPIFFYTPLKYDFHLVVAKGTKAKSIINQPPNTTFEQILTQFGDFIQFAKRTLTVSICFKGKSYLYSAIKAKLISQYSNVLSPNKNNFSNSIMILNRELGGIEDIKL